MILRGATAADLPALTEALFEAANWDGRARFTRAQLLADPSLSRYVNGWPRYGDFGTVVVTDAIDGTRDQPAGIGAAWCRTLTGQDAGYGYVADDIPELSIGVAAEHRGRGVGAALLQAVIAQAAARTVRAMSLSVEDGNRARRLYERAGFAVVGRNGGSDTMLLTVTAETTSRATRGHPSEAVSHGRPTHPKVFP